MPFKKIDCRAFLNFNNEGANLSMKHGPALDSKYES